MKKSMFKKVVFVSMALASAYCAVVFIGGYGSDSGTATPSAQAAFSGNVFLNGILPDDNYYHTHGSTSPDGSKMLVTINKADKPYGKTTGVADLYLLDAEKLSQGRVVKLLGPVSIGSNKTTPKNVLFRSTWTADGSKIMLSGGDRFWVINAADLTPLNGVDGNPNLLAGSIGDWHHNHDALPTNDGKYVLLTLRTKPHTGEADVYKMDGEIKLYDVAANAVVGAGVSVCNGCHIKQLGSNKSAILCGLDGKIEKRANGTYAGTVYVAGHGGHVAKAEVIIDPSNKAKPIAMNLDRLTVSTKKFAGTGSKSDGTSQYKLHDVRLAGNSLYWSTFNTDESNKVHYGKIDLSSGAVTKDVAIDVDSRATMPKSKAGDRGSIYCASGLSKTAFMPITMTNEVYITVIPKF
ncbi:MAG TPA: hypothetical protein DHV16_00100 [Nitrospiraceae bacterium]|nr:MAG: hypothetical protein A2Z82_12155 [Nitrospirae bacterium GWA2_46_11]HCZ10669.1 hypothetical protein [Nitrospiraceae bacterium]